ncbi:MAG TPA: GAF domain-containing protein, partial [Kofleriaceae bacterium]
MGAFELLAGLTSRVASANELADVVDPIVQEIFALGFGLIWLCAVDEATGQLATIAVRRDGLDDAGALPAAMAIDPRQPLGRSVRDRRIFNVNDPGALHIFDRDDDVVPSSTLGLTKAIAEQLRGHPFACVPLIGAGGPVGAVCLGSLYGEQPIPDELLLQGVLRAMLDLLALGLDRANGTRRAARLASSLDKAQATLVGDAPIKALG